MWNHKKIIIAVEKRWYLILTGIFLLGAALRFYHLGAVPVGFHRDEAFLGYNAYSILKTGRDLSGHVLPLHFASFLFSPGGYAYFSLPFIALFGLSEFSVRFAAAFFGSLTILTSFFMTKKLFQNREYASLLGLLTAFFLAISPWHINLSRVATENVLVVFFISLGVWLLLVWRERVKLSLLLLSFCCFALTLTIYQAPRAFLPLFLSFLFLYFFSSTWRKQMKQVIQFSGLFLLLIVLPTLLILTSHDLSQRIRMLSIFQHPATQLTIDEQIREDGISHVSPLIVRIFHNKIISYGQTFLDNYTAHFSYTFLFTDSGLPDRYRVPDMGLLYPFEIPLLLFGLWKIGSRDTKQGVFLIGWILLAPVGSALTFDDIPNLQRTLIVFPALSIISAYGFMMLLKEINIKKLITLPLLLIFPFMLFYFMYYLHQYYIHQVVHRPWYRQEGSKQMVEAVNQRLPHYKKAVITNWDSTPGIFFLFFTPYDPATVQKETAGLSPEFLSTGKFGKYQFTREECPVREDTQIDPMTKKAVLHITGQEHVLYVMHGPCKLPKKGVKKLTDIKRSDNTVIFTLVEVTQAY